MGRYIYRLIQVGNSSEVRKGAAKIIGSVFSYLPDKESAYTELKWLSQEDGDKYVRQSAINALGSAYQYLPDKKDILDHLNKLTQNSLTEIRESAHCTLGKIYVFEATLAENEDIFKRHLENALGFFEKSSNESYHDFYLNPAKFCLPFYNSFYLITFRKQEAEADVERNLNEAKIAAEGSESKENLLEAIGNLKKAKKELQNEIVFNEIRNDLIKYRQYCERASNILDTVEKKLPIPAKIIKTGFKIDERIIDEIQRNTRILCKKTQNPDIRDLGKKVYLMSRNILQIRNYEGCEKSIDNLQYLLSEICKKIPKEEGEEACKLLNKIIEEPIIEDKIALINMVLSKISQVGKWNESEYKPKTLSDRIRYYLEKINAPATIASFFGFIILEFLEIFDIYPIEYNKYKHVISVTGAITVFIIVFIFTRKKK
ncbi:MAG: hypothetical protein FIB07_14430 [Candidatus Methanoperedens sp.]|nr:hypothetical protein [Candidatus Methanoperedens sp.]